MTDPSMRGADERARMASATSGPRGPLVDTRPTETRRAFKTSEFWVFIAVSLGVIITTYADDDDDLTEWRGWLLLCVVAVAYIVSRGFAKAGSSEPRVKRVDVD